MVSLLLHISNINPTYSSVTPIFLTSLQFTDLYHRVSCISPISQYSMIWNCETSHPPPHTRMLVWQLAHHVEFVHHRARRRAMRQSKHLYFLHHFVARINHRTDKMQKINIYIFPEENEILRTGRPCGSVTREPGGIILDCAAVMRNGGRLVGCGWTIGALLRGNKGKKC